MPFDDDMNILPPEKISNDGSKFKWPSAEGFETVPDGWKPSANRPVPALRCTYERDDGSRCKNFGVRGTGFNGTRSMCFLHGGSLPAVKAKAEATVLMAKMRLIQNTGMALDTLFELTKPGTAANIRLKASTEILDRAGVKGGADLTVDVVHSVSAADTIRDKMKTLTDRARAKEDDEDITELYEVMDAEE